MSFEHRPSPSRVTEAAAAKLPRWLMFAVLAAYVIPGFFGRDPWSLDDMSAFGVMWTMATGTAVDWWLPSLTGEPVLDRGPLPFWMGALLIRAFGPLLGDIAAARLSMLFWFALGTSALWYATYRLARRDEAQPVALAFGGQATPRAYGRMLADVSVFLLVATFGVLVRIHETGAETALLALSAVLLFSLAVSLDDPIKGTMAAGITVGAIALTRGWLPAAALLAASIAFVASTGERRVWRATVMVALASIVFAAWPLGARAVVPTQAAAYLNAWWAANLSAIHWPSAENLLWIARNLGWFTWPLWPFALWTLYSWRHGLRRPHVLLPILLSVAGVVSALVSSSPADRDLMIGVPAMVVLATFGASSMKRSAEDAIDWFSMALFTLALLGTWLYFAAWSTGIPPKMAASIARLAPGLSPDAPVAAVAIAIVASLAWLAIAVWRIRLRPRVLWRGPFLAASGLALVWTVALMLFQGPIEFNRSYAPIAASLSAQLTRVGGDGCVQPLTLPPGTRAMLAYHGNVRFERPEDAGLCRVLLQRDSKRNTLDDAPPPDQWTLAYELTRRARYDEVFRIWVRRSP